jgi:hypothetical protein
VLLAETNHLRESHLRVEKQLERAQRVDKYPEDLQRRFCSAHETIEVRGGESSREAIPIGAIGGGVEFKAPVQDEQNKKLESLEVKL